MARLIATTPSGEVEVALNVQCLIGRAAMYDLPLGHDPKVSNPHARIFRQGSKYMIEDLESRNGTFLQRGESISRITQITELRSGDVIRVMATHIRFLLDSHVEAEDEIVPPRPAPGGPETPATELISSTIRRDGPPPPPPVLTPKEGEVISLEEENQRLREEILQLKRQLAREGKRP